MRAKADGPVLRVVPENTAAGKAQRLTGRRLMCRPPRRNYFFFAGFAQLALLFITFFAPHAMVVPPLGNDE